MAEVSDHKRMIELGAWLDKYINNLTLYNLQELTDEARALVGVLDGCDKDDPLVKAFQVSLSDLSKTKSNNRIQEVPRTAKEMICSLNISAGVRDSILEDLSHSINFPFYIRKYVVAQRAAEEAPWWEVLSGIRYITNDHDICLIIEEQYNNVRQLLTLEFNIPLVGKKMVFPENEIKWVRLPALIAHIFMEFLEKGGSHYASLCKNCDEFIMAERKGRRKFCSGKCRIASKRLRDQHI